MPLPKLQVPIPSFVRVWWSKLTSGWDAMWDRIAQQRQVAKSIHFVEQRPPLLAAVRFLRRRWLYIATPIVAVLFCVHAMTLWRLVDTRLEAGVFANSTNVYAAPTKISRGDSSSPRRIAEALLESGYSESSTNPAGYYILKDQAIEIRPGPQSYFSQEPATVTFKDGRIAEIRVLKSRKTIRDYQLEPALLANLSGQSRERRRLVRYIDIPQDLIHAVLSIEDKRFFEHHGFDVLRIAKAVVVNLPSGRKEQGGSTLTMQLARNIWLDGEKTWGRKFNESLITVMLEMKLSKEEIFEHYANQVYLGRRETFALHGFGEASQAFFNKEVKALKLPEMALLAGIIQRPSVFDPIKHPEDAKDRRNVVLSLMERNGYISETAAKEASASPLNVTPRMGDAEVAPYFLALAREEFREKLGKEAWKTGIYRIYTTLDQSMQRAAVEAVNAAMPEVEKRLLRGFGKKKMAELPRPQVAMVALDPHTGEIKAAVGGRDYTISQLNRLLAKRQPGSTFKPFVYAAALAGSTGKGTKKFTMATVLNDEPTMFKYGDEIYQPSNYGGKYMGKVTFRRALSRSLNNAAVSLAEQVGYLRVAELAKKAGMLSARGTPSVALGAYEVTPVELAAAYGIFPNYGDYVAPTFLEQVRDENGKVLLQRQSARTPVLDQRVAWLMIDLMKDVVQYGTAAGAGIGFTAAGKTGTSRDGWFAGFTSDLVCVVWVGFDDNRDLTLEGAHSALLVWAQFMNRAVKLGDYAKPWIAPPQGLVAVDINPLSGKLASPVCAETRQEWFVAGTEPTDVCQAGDDIVESDEEEVALVQSQTGR